MRISTWLVVANGASLALVISNADKLAGAPLALRHVGFVFLFGVVSAWLAAFFGYQATRKAVLRLDYSTNDAENLQHRSGITLQDLRESVNLADTDAGWSVSLRRYLTAMVAFFVIAGVAFVIGASAALCAVGNGTAIRRDPVQQKAPQPGSQGL